MHNKEMYNQYFYLDQAMASYRSAILVLPHFFSLFPSIKSVLDVGCGTGSWLAAAMKLGVKTIYGVEGSPDAKSMLMIPEKTWHCNDVTKPFDCHHKFDLSMSLEVAEHLTASSHSALVSNLTSHSDLILFSAAIPYQGGTGHLTENWPSYWAQLFKIKFYSCYDIIRSKIWNQRGINFWYKQNILVFIKDGEEEKYGINKSMSIDSPMSLIHPELYLWALNRSGDLSNIEYQRDLDYFLRIKDLEQEALVNSIPYGQKYNNEF